MPADLPEAEFIRGTFTLRPMDLPPSVKSTKRSMLRWFALSFGLISPNESRSTILDVLDALFYHQFTRKRDPTSTDLTIYLRDKRKPVSDKLLLYHLKRLQEARLLERRKGRYSFVSHPQEDKRNLRAAFAHHVSDHIDATLENIELLLGQLTARYK